MTKKDYIRAAEIVRFSTNRTESCKQEIAKAFLDFFRGDNPRFDEARFLEACFPCDHDGVPANKCVRHKR